MKKTIQIAAVLTLVLTLAVGCTEENVTPQTGNSTGGNVSEKGF